MALCPLPEARPCTSLRPRRRRLTSLATCEIVKQRSSAGAVANLASGQEKAERSTFCIGRGVQLRSNTAFGATDAARKAQC